MATEVLSIDLSSMEKDINTGMEMATSSSTAQDTQFMAKSTQGQSGGNNNQQKKTHRRKPSKKKRKWKPYSKMSWEERKVLEEKEKSKAYRMREEMKEKGRPVAPYNTTQFLMDEHDPFDSDTFETGYNNHSNVSATGTDEGESFSDEGGYREDQDDEMNSNCKKHNTSSAADGPDGSIEDYTDSPHMVPEFISQDFSETYERVHEERLQNMTRDELVTEHMDFEKKLSLLQDQMAKIKRSHEGKLIGLEGKIEDLQLVIESLKADNESLQKENQTLRSGRKSNSVSPRRKAENNCESSNPENFRELWNGDVMERR